MSGKDKIELIHPLPEMRQVRITTWPHRPNVYSWQMYEFDEDGQGTLVRRGQSKTEQYEGMMEMLKDFLKPDWDTAEMRYGVDDDQRRGPRD